MTEHAKETPPVDRTHYTDLDPERALLGALMGVGAIPDRLLGKMTPEAFSPTNRLIARSMVSSFQRYGKCDIISVSEEVIRLGGGLNTKDVLMGLAESAPVGADVEHLFRLVLDRNDQPTPGLPPELEHLTDMGNARRFAAQHGQNVRYCHPWNKWLTWSGKHWHQDDTGEVLRLGKDPLRRM